MATEYTVAMVKPDGVAHDLVSEILNEYEVVRGLNIFHVKVFIFTPSLAMEFYREHIDRPFFGSLIDHMTSGPTVAILLGGRDAVSLVREINGATNPTEASPTSLRGKFCVDALYDRRKPAANFVHGSDSLKSASREIQMLRLTLKATKTRP